MTGGAALCPVADGLRPGLAPPAFTVSISGILPLAPHLAYVTDAVVDAGVHVFDEAYLPACGPRWLYIVKADTEKTFSENGVVGPSVDVGHPAGLRLRFQRLPVPRA